MLAARSLSQASQRERNFKRFLSNSSDTSVALQIAAEVAFLM